MTTTPFRSTKLIDAACNKAKNYPMQSILSMVNVGANHPYRMYTMNKDYLNQLIDHTKDPMLARQLLPPVYIRSGDIYLTKRDCILNKKSLIGNISIGIEIPEDEAINIDSEYDLIIAEYTMMNKNK